MLFLCLIIYISTKINKSNFVPETLVCIFRGFSSAVNKMSSNFKCSIFSIIRELLINCRLNKILISNLLIMILKCKIIENKNNVCF